MGEPFQARPTDPKGRAGVVGGRATNPASQHSKPIASHEAEGVQIELIGTAEIGARWVRQNERIRCGRGSLHAHGEFVPVVETRHRYSAPNDQRPPRRNSRPTPV